MLDYLEHLLQQFPILARRFDELRKDKEFSVISKKQFKVRKEKLLVLERAFDNMPELDLEGQKKLIDTVLRDGTQKTQGWSLMSGLKSVLGVFLSDDPTPANTFGSPHAQQHSQGKLQQLGEDVRQVDDVSFLSKLPALTDKFPALTSVATDVVSLVREHFTHLIQEKSHKFAASAEAEQAKIYEKGVLQDTEKILRDQVNLSRATFLAAVSDKFLANPSM